MDENTEAKTEIVTGRNTSFVMKTGSVSGTMKISYFPCLATQFLCEDRKLQISL